MATKAELLATIERLEDALASRESSIDEIAERLSINGQRASTAEKDLKNVKACYEVAEQKLWKTRQAIATLLEVKHCVRIGDPGEWFDKPDLSEMSEDIRQLIHLFELCG